MGLSFRESNAQWSYIGFNAFRRKLAKQVGMELGLMEGFGGDISWCFVTDPIRHLLNHSDCEGSLDWGQLMILYPRLKELLSTWEDGHDKQNGLELCEDMRRLAHDGGTLNFT